MLGIVLGLEFKMIEGTAAFLGNIGFFSVVAICMLYLCVIVWAHCIFMRYHTRSGVRPVYH